MDTNIHKIPELIFKQFNQTITGIEEKKLNEWIKSSDRNKKLYKEIIDTENITSSLNRHFEYDDEEAMKKIQKKVKPHTFGKGKFISILKYAAIIISFLAGGYFMINKFLSPEKKDLFAMTELDFQPGNNRAVLKLGDGKEIKLGESNIAKEIKIDHLTTAIDKDFSLTYNESIGAVENERNHTLVVPIGSEYKLVLPDGTKVWVNSSSQISFPVQFTNDIRKVQVQGEAYFDVVYNQEQPFVVGSSSYSIEVLGTSFNIMNYSDEKYSATTLVEGKVKIRDNSGGKSIELKPGEQAVLDYESHIYSVKKVEISHYIAWKEGLFSYQSDSLARIMRTLSRWYNCDFQFEDPSLENLHFTGTLDKDQSLKNILLLISETCSVNFSINKEKTIIITLK